jgi:KipI family sensor histidine kinase inhibitor
MVVAIPRISPAGSGALLFDSAKGAFSDAVQRRIWAISEVVLRLEGVRETAPGMNNLLVLFDPLIVDAADVGALLQTLWAQADAVDVVGRQHTISVKYGGKAGEDIVDWAAHCGLTVEEAIRRHSDATYTVAAVGAMPGFPYLSGLDPSLAKARRGAPRFKVAEGSVIIGGAQAGIMPMTAPSGWHIIGHSDVKLFDPAAETPVLLRPGDTIRFAIASIEA